MSTLHSTRGGRARLLAVKGNPQDLLARCSQIFKGGRVLPLAAAGRALIQAENEVMAGRALRVLGFAYRDIKGEDQGDEHGLVWLGLVGMHDPPRLGVRELVSDLKDSGIHTVMVTGDQSTTAEAIGRDLGLNGSAPLHVADADEVSHLSAVALERTLKDIQIFSRVNPAEKLTIVQAIQKLHKVVAMTGDGINDGPALKAADVGVAMGPQGTAVAWDSADIVLLSEDLSSLRVAVAEGRAIRANLRKAIGFMLATNASELGIMLTSLALGRGQALTPAQLLWINLVTDIAPGLALATDVAPEHLMTQAPVGRYDPIFSPQDYRGIRRDAVAMTASVLLAQGLGMRRYGEGLEAGTMATLTLVLGQALYVFSAREPDLGVLDRRIPPLTSALKGASASMLLAQGLAISSRRLSRVLGFCPLRLTDLVAVGGLSTIPFLVRELAKSIPLERASPRPNLRSRGQRLPIHLPAEEPIL
jgi:Ca2+-transporting ATPase